MHEYSVVSALLDRVEAEARSRSATTVKRIRVRIGELSGIEPDLFATAFATFREKTICANAELQIDRVETRWSCAACGRRFQAGEALSCEPCGLPARLEGGDEIMLDQIEMEVP